MAERRMFAKTIIDSDAFLDMPQSTQLLYFHLSMRGDDEGFINNPKSIMRNVGCKEDDIKLLIAKKFLIPFESGVVVIKHWKIHNYIQKDRFTPTKYQEEKATLTLDENKAYTPCIHSVSALDTQDRLGKDSLELGKYNIPQTEPEKEKTSAKVTQKANAFAYLVKDYDEEIRLLLLDWLDVRKAKRAAQTERAIMLNLNKLEKMAKESNLTVSEYLEEVIRRGWAAFFPIKSFDNSNGKPKQETKVSYDLTAAQERALHSDLTYRKKEKK